MEPTGLEGTINLQFQCNGYKLRLVTFQGSSFVEGSKRTVVGLALGIAFFLTEHGFANFERTLKQCLGISCISKNSLFIYLFTSLSIPSYIRHNNSTLLSIQTLTVLFVYL